MAFLMGPRQVGKTTISLQAAEEWVNHRYFNWDNPAEKLLFLEGGKAIADQAGLNEMQTGESVLIFDEIHKYGKWKNFLKGFFDLYESKTKIIVTGSARLNIYKKGGDSLMGRYFYYRIHPLSVGEIAASSIPLYREGLQNWATGKEASSNSRSGANGRALEHAVSEDEKSEEKPTPPETNSPFTNGIDTDIRPRAQSISDANWQALIEHGGFPEPFLQRSDRFSKRWQSLRKEQLFREDIRDHTRVQELAEIELLSDLLKDQAAQAMDYASLAKKIKVSVDTVRRWIEVLKSFYFCYTLQPWSKNVARSLIKEPKIYLWDWSQIENEGQRLENMVASHLLKSVDYWNDRGLGEYGLYYLRTKDKREVDFVVTKHQKPWFIAEVKAKAKGLSSSLYHFQQELGVPHAFQLAFDLPFVEGNCFNESGPILVPARTFLSQCV
jgi:predicted AAA+ superfamily ATPase